MHIDELIEQQEHKDRQKTRPRKRHALKLALLIVAGLIVASTIIVLLLLHKPSSYEPPQTIEDRQVSKYLTHVISQDLYNGAQTGEPFDLLITEEGIGDIVARSGWPKQVGEASFATPEVKFEPDNILLRGMVNLDTVELFVVIEGTGRIDEQGLLHLNVTKVKIGAVSVTIIAKLLAAAIYNNEATRRQLEEDDWRAKIMAALLLDRPFEPVFEIEQIKVRIDNVRIEAGKITIHLVPEKL
jgi:hypothetical protein